MFNSDLDTRYVKLEIRESLLKPEPKTAHLKTFIFRQAIGINYYLQDDLQYDIA